MSEAMVTAEAVAKPSYPVQVVAVDSAGGVPRRPGTPDEGLAADLGAIGHLVVWASGHGKCGFWAFDHAEQVIRCSCGQARWKLGDPLPGVTA